MWMMSYSDGGGDFNVPDSFNGRKLRPLVPRPLSSANNNNNPSSPTPPCLTRFHGPDFFSLNHQLGSHFGEQNKREYNTAPVVVSSRWNPTPEQLRTLEELYRRGTRTPTADQIQHITAQLRRYGKIEGKNVFYWFQNHKARERQKRRRQMESSALDHNNNDLHLQDMDRNKDSGENRTAYEVEQNKTNWAAPTNCSTLSERIKTKAAGGSIQLHEAELLLQQQQRRNFVERNATWQNMMHDQVSCPPPKTPRSMEANQQLMMMKSGTTTRDLNIFLTPYKANDALLINDEEHEDSHQTLELFPLRSGDAVQNNNFDKATSDVSLVSAADANLNPNYHFFEFLPLKDN